MAILSVLDLSPINEGGTVTEALNNSRLLACLLYTSDAADE